MKAYILKNGGFKLLCFKPHSYTCRSNLFLPVLSGAYLDCGACFLAPQFKSAKLFLAKIPAQCSTGHIHIPRFMYLFLTVNIHDVTLTLGVNL